MYQLEIFRGINHNKYYTDDNFEMIKIPLENVFQQVLEKLRKNIMIFEGPYVKIIKQFRSSHGPILIKRK